MGLQEYVHENDASEQRLIAQVSQLRSADYAADMGGGWTIATALAHLAFWDTCRLALLQRWLLAGFSDAPADSDIVNAGVEVLANAIPGSAAGKLAVRAAQAIDAEVRKVPAELAEAIEADGQLTVLRRSVHRNSHLDDIAMALKPA
jgi:hypothetical protein